MGLYSIILENKFMLEIAYAFLISLICAVIVFKTDKFFKLSLHQGIRYFRNAFLFFGLAFIGRYIFGVLSDMDFDYVSVVQVTFEYLLVMAGFFLLYSLVWKKFESPKEKYFSSLFNTKVAIFHIMALVIAVLDNLWQTYNFMFFSQIIIFFYISILSYINYRKDMGKHKFPKFYFIAMILGLGVWILNFVAETYLQWNHGILIDIGIINIIFFALFLYGVIKVTKIK
jgi:hypothetical protein